MKRHAKIIKTITLGALAQALLVFNVQAQDLTITNARIIVTPGNIIENGSIVVEDGRITSVSADGHGRIYR